MFGAFIGGLAGFSGAISSAAGYHFGTTFLAVVSGYAVLLMAYVGSRRIAQKLRVARARQSSEATFR
jgi:hypothetical protein